MRWSGYGLGEFDPVTAALVASDRFAVVVVVVAAAAAVHDELQPQTRIPRSLAELTALSLLQGLLHRPSTKTSAA